MGKDIMYIGVWKKGDDRMVYNMIYSDGISGKGFVKRFAMPGVIRDNEYDLTQGNPNSRVHGSSTATSKPFVPVRGKMKYRKLFTSHERLFG